MASKLVLVTGASSGIGAATARRYGAAGAHVLLLARNTERLERVGKAVGDAGGTASLFPVDLQDTGATEEVAGRIERDIGTPDVLINNAGAGQWLPLSRTSPAQAAAMMAVPYLAAFTLTRCFAPAMTARGSGAIGFVTSPASYLAWPNASGYIAARRAIAGLAESLRSELKPAGVSVTLVVLGAVETPYWENNPESLQNVPKVNPRLLPTLSPEEAADAIFEGVGRKTLRVVKPAAYRALIILNALFPKTVASRMRRAAKKAKS